MAEDRDDDKNAVSTVAAIAGLAGGVVIMVLMFALASGTA